MALNFSVKNHSFTKKITGLNRSLSLIFYCSRLKLVIEVDGEIHNHQKQYDRERDHVIAELGLQVFRINNEETEYPDLVRSKILKITDQLQSTHNLS